MIGRLPVARSLVLLVVSAMALATCSQDPPPLAFAPDRLPEASVGVPYNAKITVTGNRTPVFLFTAGNDTLPPGLQVALIDGETATGHVFGTPAAAGSFTFTVTALCFGTNVSGQTGSREYTLTVR